MKEEKILLVDDDENVLKGYHLNLRKRYDLDFALGPEDALAKCKKTGPYAVVISDLRMPGMDGIQLLSKIRERYPQTVRMMLTGHAEVEVAIDAVNEGCVFRFMTKPCPPEILSGSIEAGLKQYRLVRAEKELMEKTLKGAVKILADTLSLTSPLAFGRASRVKRLMSQMATELKVQNGWQWELAAMLSQVGCVSLPADLLEKVAADKMLTAAEEKLFLEHPKIGADLISNVPRLGPISEIVAYQEKNFDGSGIPRDGRNGKEIPMGARALKVALSFDTKVMSGKGPWEAYQEMRDGEGRFDPDMVEALRVLLKAKSTYGVRSVDAKDLAPGMVLAEDVKTTNGQLLIAKGQEVTVSIKLRLMNLAITHDLKEPIRVEESQ